MALSCSVANAALPPTVLRCSHCISFFCTALHGRSTRSLTSCPHTVAQNPAVNHTQACVNAHWSKHRKKCKPCRSQMLTFPWMQHPGQVRVFSKTPLNFNLNHCSWAFIILSQWESKTLQYTQMLGVQHMILPVQQRVQYVRRPVRKQMVQYVQELCLPLSHSLPQQYVQDPQYSYAMSPPPLQVCVNFVSHTISLWLDSLTLSHSLHSLALSSSPSHSRCFSRFWSRSHFLSLSISLSLSAICSGSSVRLCHVPAAYAGVCPCMCEPLQGSLPDVAIY